LKAKEENISIFGLKSKFGGGRSTGFALIYDSLDARKKFDSKKMLRRVSISYLRCLPSLRRRRRGKAESYINLPKLTMEYYIGRLHPEIQDWKKAEKGNQGQSQEGQRYC
jgi:hypothetical protein